MSSSDLLKRIEKRNHQDLFRPEMQTGSDRVELLKDIRNYVAINGTRTSDELVNMFKDRVPKKDSPLFKAILNEICDFAKKKDAKGKGIWTLKREFV